MPEGDARHPCGSLGNARVLKNWLATENRFLVWALGLLLLGATLQAWHLAQRRALEMPISAQEGSGDLVKAGIYSLGSVRGLVATALWMEVVDAKNQRDFVRLKGNCDLLMEVQPKFTSTAKFLAYTEIYDLPDQMPGIDEKYYWVRSGLNILDAGYRRNTFSAALPQQLALNYNFRFSDLKSDGAALAERDALATRPVPTDLRADAPVSSDWVALCPVDRLPGDTAPRYSLPSTLADGKTPVVRRRCIECFYWTLYYGSQAARKNDANFQSIYTDIQDCHKKIAWYSDWPTARRHLIAARDCNVLMDSDAARRNLPYNDGFRENFCSEMFYYLLEVLPRRARDDAERAEIAAEVRRQWDWYRAHFVPPAYPAQPRFESARQAADVYIQAMLPKVADWNNLHPDAPIVSIDQLPH